MHNMAISFSSLFFSIFTVYNVRLHILVSFHTVLTTPSCNLCMLRNSCLKYSTNMMQYCCDNLSFVLTAILDDSQSKQSVTFMSLKPHMTELLLRFLRAETDATNTQMLLGNCCFVLSVGVLAVCRTVAAKQ